MSDNKDLMATKPLTLAQIITLCGFLIVGTFYITKIYSEFEHAKNEREEIVESVEYLDTRVTKITSRNADAIKELHK